MPLKVIEFAGRSHLHLCAFPLKERVWAAFQLYRLQLRKPVVTRDEVWEGLGRCFTRRRGGAKFGVYYLSNGFRNVQVFGAVACYCGSKVDQPCIGSGRGDESEENLELRTVFKTAWHAIGDDRSSVVDLKKRADIANRLIDEFPPARVPFLSQARLRDLRCGDIASLSLKELQVVLSALQGAS